MSKVLEVNELCKSYGEKEILKNITFSVDSGDIVGFLGSNGAGKTTTMNIICGYLSPTSGNVKVCGYDVTENDKQAKSKIGYLPEIPPLYTDRTVYEYLSFVYDLKKCKMDKRSHINECMKLVKIEDISKRIIKNLSKGYRQRVGIAQALIGNPELLILDEPTVGLDPIQIMEIRDLINNLGKNRTVIISTHILQEVTAVCNKIIIINDGTIKACDTIRNIENCDKCVYKVKLLCDENSMKEITEKLNVSYKPLNVSSEECCFEMIFNKEEAKCKELFELCSSKKVPMIELTPISRTIEDVFMQYTV